MSVGGNGKQLPGIPKGDFSGGIPLPRRPADPGPQPSKRRSGAVQGGYPGDKADGPGGKAHGDRGGRSHHHRGQLLYQLKGTRNGLDEEKGNYSTAYDMAILTSYAMKNKTYRKIVSTKKYTLKTNMNTYIWYNKNKLLKSYSYTTGGKTGFTKIARRTLVTTASKDNLNLVVVTLNDGDDFNDHKNLFEYAFENYKNYKILNKGNIEIDDDYYSDYKLYIKDDVYYPLSADEKNSINIKYKLEKKRKLKNNLVVGKAEIYLGDKLVKEVNIYVRVKEEKLNFFDKIKRWFNDK